MSAAESGGRWQRVWEIFHRVVESAPAERTSELERACGSDAELRREVEELLTAHESGSPVLDRPPPVNGLPALLDGSTSDGATYLAAGTVLAGRFGIVRLLGVGGMGEVYEVRDRELGSRVAVKLLPLERAASPSALARFRHEILLAQKVTHRNVCRVYDLVRDGERSFLTMELLAGETLAVRLERAGRMDLDEARTILEQIVAGLEAAHAIGVVHRDLKPSNVVLVDEDGGRRVVVTDFGLATSSSATADGLKLTRTGEIVGTLGYMAPEQLEGGGIGPWTDVYALGLLAFEMVTGRPPFAGGSAFSVARQRLEGPAPSPRRARPDLDPEWEAAILRCLERRPAERFQHPREMLGALLEPTIELAPAPRSRRGKGWRRTTAWVGLGVAVGLVLYWSARTLRREPAAAEAPPASVSPLAPAIRPMVLVGALDNRTGNAALDGVLAAALTHELADSTFVGVASSVRVQDVLRLMREPTDVALDATLARQVALRDGAIAAVVTGEIEGVGDGVVVRARLVAPHDGEQLASWSEQSGTAVAEIQSALARIARGVREELGESLGRVAAGGEAPERVTTPSWRALRLFDEAEAVIARFNLEATAEELLREAIREDPSFASAHIFLAHALFNQGRPREEVLAAAERAMALADEVSDRERFFVRGSYFFFQGDAERSRANYEALLRLHPDHYWANSNLAGLLGPTPGIPYMVRKGQSRPHDLDANWDAAHALAIVGGHLEEAQPFVDRIVALAQVEIQRLQDYEAAWGRQWSAHRSWLAGDLEGARAELDHLATALERQTGNEAFWTRTLLVHAYRTLGMARRARELVLLPQLGGQRRFLSGLDAFLSGDSDGTRRGLADLERSGSWPGWTLLEDPLRVAGLARRGAVDEARRVADEFPRTVQKNLVPEFEEGPGTLAALMAAELDLAAGRAEAAVRALEAILGLDWEHYGVAYHLTAQALALAYRRLGRAEEAVVVLERAVAKRARSYPLGRELSLATQLGLAELEHELGHVEKARRLEAELAELARLADPDFWLRRRLAARTGN